MMGLQGKRVQELRKKFLLQLIVSGTGQKAFIEDFNDQALSCMKGKDVHIICKSKI